MIDDQLELVIDFVGSILLNYDTANINAEQMEEMIRRLKIFIEDPDFKR